MATRPPVHKLLSEYGVQLDDFPEAIRTNRTFQKVLRYAEELPHERRAEYFVAAREFFCTYERLDETAREEMLEYFKSLLYLLRPSASKTKQ
jgi:hypothetical protein